MHNSRIKYVYLKLQILVDDNPVYLNQLPEQEKSDLNFRSQHQQESLDHICTVHTWQHLMKNYPVN